MSDSPVLSIVITAYTAERLNDIYELLESIKGQTYLHKEILFVVERSKDLMEKIRFYGVEHKIPHLKVLFNKGEQGLSAARNIGIKQSNGEIIAFVDDDVLLYPDWAEKMVNAYNDDSIIGVTGPAFPLWEDESMAWFPKELYWIISCTAWDTEDYVKEVRNACGMNMSFKRETFEKAGMFSNEFGYHKGPMAEDNEFSLRIKEKTGKKIFYDPDVKLWHRVHKYRLSRKFIKERSYWIGYSRRMLKQGKLKNRKDGTKILSQEYRLLNRILTGFFPDVIKKLFTNPVVAWRITRVTVAALTFVTLGYYSPLMPKFLQKIINTWGYQ
jgi:glucosyl-dolichyl phosphate glucuronosyltransferase